MRKLWAAAVIVMATASCTDNPTTISTTAIAGPTPTLAPLPLPTNVPGVLALQLPIEVADLVNTTVGIEPFGYHGATHAAAGHTGWDIEYRSGSLVRAAAAGAIENVIVDGVTDRFTVQIEHVVGDHHYRTTYSNIVALAADIAETEVVRAGQALGVAGGISHFQSDDFEFYRDIGSPNAVSAELFLTPEARAAFDRVWPLAIYAEELVEPFATNPRERVFPASRTWIRAGGDGPAGIRFTRRTPTATDYDYALLTESGTAVEVGTVVLNTTVRPVPTIDLVSATSRRLGLYDIVSNEMRLTLAEPNAARPAALASAGVYRTAR